MEGTNNEVIFESLNLSPQLFINEVLNVVDCQLDEAFNFFLQEASALLKTEGTDRSAELAEGLAYIRDLVQATLDQRMQKWEEYCLKICFNLPEEFSLPKPNVLGGDDLPDIDALTDNELDAQLNSLRERLTQLTTMASEFRTKLGNLKRRMEDTQCDRANRLHVRHDDVLALPGGNNNCLFGLKLDELQEFFDMTA